MPRRNALSTKDTNSRPWPPPGVILSEGSWGIASIDPNYKVPAGDTNTNAEPTNVTEHTKKEVSSKPIASGANFSEGTRGVVMSESSSKPTATKPNPSNTKQKGTKRKSDSVNDNGENAPASRRVKKERASEYPKDKNNLIDVSSVYLDDEEYKEVPVYATATDIRRELTGLLQSPGVSAAGLCRTLSAASGVTISAQRLRSFRNKGKKKGGASVDGADSPAFYAAYVYLEKVRVLTRGRKSKHRLEMEEAWGEDGMCMRGLQTYVIKAGDSLEYDRLGRMVMGGRVCDHSGWRSLGSAFGF